MCARTRISLHACAHTRARVRDVTPSRGTCSEQGNWEEGRACERGSVAEGLEGWLRPVSAGGNAGKEGEGQGREQVAEESESRGEEVRASTLET